MFAAHHRLGSLTVLLDANDSQVDGPVSSITTLEPIAAKWESFGWAAFDVDGHDTAALDAALSAAAADPRPAVVIGRTSTRHGLSVLPEDADGHFIKLPADARRGRRQGAGGAACPVTCSKQPYPTVMKPYGRALVDLARERPEILCLTGDLTRQTEVDLFQEEIPERFIHGGMAEANMISMAGALARRGFLPFVHTFGVFATRRPLDQIINSVAYPNLPVRIVGFMPGVSSPGGPSHQAIDDVALMRAIPNMTVVDVADATQIRAALPAVTDLPGARLPAAQAGRDPGDLRG